MKKIFLVILAITLMAISCTKEDVKVGIVKTSNGGVDWQSANKIKDTEKTLLERSISRLSYNNAGDKVYASSYEGGLYFTDDAGENWSEALGNVPLYDFTFHPYDDQIIYAASYMDARGRLLVTRDGGKSWTEIYSDAGEKNPVRAVALNPSNPSEVIIGMGKGALIMSNDEGNNWRLLQNYNDRISRIVWTSTDLFVVVDSTGVFRSSDGGNSSRQITRSLSRLINRSQMSFFGAGGVNEYHQVAVSSSDSNLLYLSTNKGLFRSSNGGDSWRYVSMPVRVEDAKTFAVSISPQNDSVLYASAGSVIFKSLDGGESWSSSDTGTNGLVTSILINPNQSMLVFAGVSK